MRVGVISTGFDGRIPHSKNETSRELYDKCGYNSGNLAFWGGVSKIIDNDIRYYSWDFNPEALAKELDVLVFPAANQVSEGNDLGFFADRLDKTNLPMVVVGLGAQAPAIGATISLSPGTRRWLDLISERSVKLGVRGNYTAETLSNMGIKNVEVTGCPSLFINENVHLGSVLESKYQSSIRRPLVYQGEMNANTKAFEQAAFSFSVGNQTSYVCQAPLPAVSIARQDFSSVSESDFKNFREYYAPGIDEYSLLNHMMYRMRVFFDYQEWIDFAKAFDFSFGARLHGNFLSMQAEVPALVVTHDSRTLELAQTVMAPVISIGDALEKLKNPTDLFSGIEFDGGAYDRNRSYLAREYSNIFASSGIRTKAYLQGIASSHL